ncbi:uncharacterized protein LOC125677597 [Ostrea edulis]|uniref:uncharacterized protein LOC125677597 n=1 Tax=Ostrea edulis TaxID=37623 RepID=UPI0024AF1E4F|nr:uncharacterized protein LOC125677597 [Ostrea edulis]
MTITVNKVTHGIALYNSRNNLPQASCEGYDPSITTIEICEVMVMGCQSQRYGEKCSLCDKRCLNKQCDVFNGSCIYGCENSLMEAPDCSNCKSGFYGRNCKKRCGHCKFGTHCNDITGICPEGCQDTWEGPPCSDAGLSKRVLVIISIISTLVIVMIIWGGRRLMCRRKRKSQITHSVGTGAQTPGDDNYDLHVIDVPGDDHIYSSIVSSLYDRVSIANDDEVNNSSLNTVMVISNVNEEYSQIHPSVNEDSCMEQQSC